jgi:hypothetical protein
MRARVVALALVPAILALQGCGSESDLEKSLRKSINAQSTADVQFVACPKNVTTGQTFHCKAVVPVDVTQLDQNGNLRWQITNLSGNPPGATGASAPIGPTLGTSGVIGPTGTTGATVPGGPTFPTGATGGKGAGKEGKIKLVPFRNTQAGFVVSHPSNWTQTGSGSAVNFSAPNGRFESLTSNKLPTMPTAAGVTNALKADKSISGESAVTKVKIGPTTALMATYTQKTGKGNYFVRRYVFWQKGTHVVLVIGSPPNSAQVPNFVRRAQDIANSFRWL